MKTFCQGCGQETKKYEINCAHCGVKLNVPNIPSYTKASIVAMILFFLPTGLVALISSLQVNNKIKEGNFEEAIKYSKRALLWCWISFGIAAILLISYALRFINQ
jgi:uncharacterized paraquat-inducible protein A